jgi:hypothetical protein
MKRVWLFGAAFLLALAPQTAQARAWIGFGINIGVPVCYPYYRPYPVYAYPGPVYVYPAPAYAPPVYVSPGPAVYQAPAQVVTPPPPPPPANAVTVPQSAVGAAYSEPANMPRAQDGRQNSVNRYLQQLSDPAEQTRADAAIELGRMRAAGAVDSLISVLTGDRSPAVRESAARALGLIASPRSLQALQTSAQADADRDVRHSAQFAAEVIRTNLRRD